MKRLKEVKIWRGTGLLDNIQTFRIIFIWPIPVYWIFMMFSHLQIILFSHFYSLFYQLLFCAMLETWKILLLWGFCPWMPAELREQCWNSGLIILQWGRIIAALSLGLLQRLGGCLKEVWRRQNKEKEEWVSYLFNFIN